MFETSAENASSASFTKWVHLDAAQTGRVTVGSDTVHITVPYFGGLGGRDLPGNDALRS